MMAFGGSGPIHAGVLGREIGVPKVIIPGGGMATALSAFGLMSSDLRHTVAQSRALSEPIRFEDVAESLDDVKGRAMNTVRGWGVADSDILIACSIDMRFIGQVHSVNVKVPSDVRNAADVDAIFDRFVEAYERFFGPGTAHRAAGIEMVTFRAEATGQMTKPEFPRAPLRERASLAPKARRAVNFAGKAGEDVPIYAGLDLMSGDRIPGPAVVEYDGNTVVVHPGQAIDIDEFGNLVFASGASQ